MTKKLFLEAVCKFLLGVLLVGLIIFLPAGTLNFPGGKLLMTLLFVPMFAAGVVMMIKNPSLLKSRLNAREKQSGQKGQKVIDTGLYAVVRHPMYMATLILFLAMPVILGSLPALIVFLAYPALIVRRIRNEEQVLARDLPGYKEYMQKVKYRLIPFLW